MIPLPVIKICDATGATSLGVLGGVSDLKISEVFGEGGALSVTLPRNETGAALLDTDDDRQVELIWPDVTAPMVFVLDDDDSTWISDAPESEPITFTCRDLHALTDEALVAPISGIGSLPAVWPFTGVTPGKVVADLFAAAQARGLLQGLTLAGDATVDASGVAWGTTVTNVYKAGATLTSVLTALRDAQLVEHRFVGRTLELHRPGGAMDRSPDIVLRPRRDVLSAPMKRSRRSVASAVIVEGSDEVTVRRTATLTGRRNREFYVSQNSAPSGALNGIGDLFLAAHDTADVQFTHDLTDADDGPVPWLDYQVGDRLLTLAAGPTSVRRRVQQIALSMADSGVTATLELGSILRTAEEAMNLKLARLLPGEA